jgi:hypothetical protein
VAIVVMKEKQMLIFICDGCRKTLTLTEVKEQEEGALQAPWGHFQLPGWVGNFHVCSADCDVDVRARFNRGRVKA